MKNLLKAVIKCIVVYEPKDVNSDGTTQSEEELIEMDDISIDISRYEKLNVERSGDDLLPSINSFQESTRTYERAR